VQKEKMIKEEILSKKPRISLRVKYEKSKLHPYFGDFTKK
jgi:hypothetical protein